MEGTWAKDDLRRAFVAGASWWEFESMGGTMWQSDIDMVEVEAQKRYPSGVPITPMVDPLTGEDLK